MSRVEVRPTRAEMYREIDHIKSTLLRYTKTQRREKEKRILRLRKWLYDCTSCADATITRTAKNKWGEMETVSMGCDREVCPHKEWFDSLDDDEYEKLGEIPVKDFISGAKNEFKNGGTDKE